MRVKKSLLKFISKDVENKKRLQSARREGAEFLALSPTDQVTALFVFSHDSESEIAAAAYETLAGAEPDFILRALGEALHHLVLRDLFVHFRENGTVLSAILRNTGIDRSLAFAIAREGPLEVLETIRENPSLTGRFPSIIDGIKNNPLSIEGLTERLESAAKDAQGENDPAPIEEIETQGEATITDIIASGEEFDSDRFNVYQAICKMTAGEKIKLAHTGDRSVRNLLIKDKNKVVAHSVLKNPKLTEQEVIMAASSTNTSEEILREINNSREWLKSYNIKTALVFNPRTPLSSSLRLVDYLRERELKQLAKNKGVPGALVNAAARKLKLKKRH
ncbi:MAG: hypothetical protein ACE5DR_05950 [Thermodesulfobacteriota bacterium]